MTPVTRLGLGTTTLTVDQRNRLVEKCESCGGVIAVDDGDVLYDGKWYHGRCWEQVKR